MRDKRPQPTAQGLEQEAYKAFEEYASRTKLTKSTLNRLVFAAGYVAGAGAVLTEQLEELRDANGFP